MAPNAKRTKADRHNKEAGNNAPWNKTVTRTTEGRRGRTRRDRLEELPNMPLDVIYEVRSQLKHPYLPRVTH